MNASSLGRRHTNCPDTVPADSFKAFRGRQYRQRKRIHRASYQELNKLGLGWTTQPKRRTRGELSFLANAVLHRLCEEDEDFICTNAAIAKACEGVSRRQLQSIMRELEEHGYKRVYTGGQAAAGQDRVGREYEFTNVAGQWWSESPQTKRQTSTYQIGSNQNGRNNNRKTLLDRNLSKNLSFKERFLASSSEPGVSRDRLESETPTNDLRSDTPVKRSYEAPLSGELSHGTTWGKDPDGCFEWVKRSFYADEFRKILGYQYDWDRNSAKSFYRGFHKGRIRPADIVIMARLGQGAIQSVLPDAVGSLSVLCRRWGAVVREVAAEDECGTPWSQRRQELIEETLLRPISEDDGKAFVPAPEENAPLVFWSRHKGFRVYAQRARRESDPIRIFT